MTKEGYSTTTINSYLWAGAVKSSFGISTERESSSQLGSQDTIVDDLVRHPNVEFSVDYLFSPNLLNEKLVGFSTGSYIESGTFADMGNDNYNFIHVHRNRQYYDALEHYKEGSYNDNYEAVCLGNMFLNSYRVQYSLGEVVTASMNFIGSNANYEGLSSNTVVNPSVDLAAGTYDPSGDISLHPPLEYGMGYSGIHDRSLPSLVSRRNITPELQNLQMGGQTLSGDHFLQNFDLSLNFNRVDAYGLGSDYVYGRNLQYPIRGQASLSSYVSGFNEGQISGMLEGETGYEFTINFADEDNLINSYYRVENAKLESFDYSMDVNGEMLMNASFSFIANQQGGMYNRQRLNFPTAPDLYLDVADSNGWDGESLFDLSDSERPTNIIDAGSDGSIDVLNTQQKNLRLNSRRIEADINTLSARTDQTINIIAGMTGAGPFTYASVNSKGDISDTPHIIISGDSTQMYFTFGAGPSLAVKHIPVDGLAMVTAVDNPAQNRVECYIDGQFVTGADSSHSSASNADVVTINAEHETEGIGFLFQSTAHFNSALSAAEITQLYNIFKGRLELSPFEAWEGLGGEWFEGFEGGVVQDFG